MVETVTPSPATSVAPPSTTASVVVSVLFTATATATPVPPLQAPGLAQLPSAVAPVVCELDALMILGTSRGDRSCPAQPMR